MVWNVRFHPAIKKDLSRLPPEARVFILRDTIPAIVRDPYKGEPLRGPLKGFLKYRSSENRVAYSIDEKRHEIVILEIGPRGGFYERLRRRLDK